MQTLTPAMRKSLLISLLRDPSRWPKDFRWDFMDSTCCAMGLHAQVFENRIFERATGLVERRHLQEVLNLTEGDGTWVFSLGGRNTTADDVANRLEMIT